MTPRPISLWVNFIPIKFILLDQKLCSFGSFPISSFVLCRILFEYPPGITLLPVRRSAFIKKRCLLPFTDLLRQLLELETQKAKIEREAAEQLAINVELHRRIAELQR